MLRQQLARKISANDLDAARSLIDKIDAEELIQTKDLERTESPFHEAALCKHPEIMELLIQKVSKIKGLEKISLQNKRGETPLHLAAGQGNNAVVKLLLDNMPRKAIDALDKFGDATLRAVIEKCSEDTATLMLRRMSEHSKYEVLRNAAEQGNNEVFKLLLSKMSQKANETPLHTAAQNGHDKVVELLLSEMSQNSIDAATDSRVGPGDFGYTALHLAAKQGSLKVVGLLLDKMSKKAINDVTHYKYTALHFAAENGRDEVVELLLGKMSQDAIDASTISGYTALYLAVAKCSEDTIKLVFDKMSPEAVSVITNFGDTALHLAVQHGYNTVVELLLSKMSLEAINSVTKFGTIALHLADQNGHNEMVKLLLGRISPKAVDFVNEDSGYTALHIAVKHDYNEEAQSLLGKMSPEAITAKSKSGESFLDIIMTRDRITQKDLEGLLHIFIDRHDDYCKASHKTVGDPFASILVGDDRLPQFYNGVLAHYSELKTKLEDIIEYSQSIKTIYQQICYTELSPLSDLMDKKQIKQVFANVKKLNMVLEEAITVFSKYKEKDAKSEVLFNINDIAREIKSFLKAGGLEKLLKSITMQLVLEEFLAPKKENEETNAELFAKEVGLIEKIANQTIEGHSESFRLANESVEYLENIIARNLNQAIRNNDYTKIENILKAHQNLDILTILDEVKDTPIYVTLLVANPKSLEIVAQHIDRYEGKMKRNLEGDSLGEIAAVIELPQHKSLTPQSILDIYIKPLYTKESVDNLIQLIGQDIIDGYY